MSAKFQKCLNSSQKSQYHTILDIKQDLRKRDRQLDLYHLRIDIVRSLGTYYSERKRRCQAYLIWCDLAFGIFHFPAFAWFRADEGDYDDDGEKEKSKEEKELYWCWWKGSDV